MKSVKGGLAGLGDAWSKKNHDAAKDALKSGDVILAAQLTGMAGDPSNLSSDEKKAVAEVYYQKGKQEFDLGRFDLAIISFRKALNLDSSHALAHRRVQLLQSGKPVTTATVDDLPAIKLMNFRKTLGINCYKTVGTCRNPGGESYLHCAECKNLIRKPTTSLQFLENIADFHAIGVYRFKGDERGGEEYSRLIRRIKQGDQELPRALAEILAESIKKRTSYLAKVDFITAVPADPLRLQERGCNPPSLVAMDLAKILRIPFIDGILTKKAADHAKDLNYFSVKQNFHLSQEKVSIRNRNILLIDDVTTRGYTLSACATLLKEAGAKEVYAALLAQSETTNRETVNKMIKIEKLANWYMVSQCKYLGPVRFRELLKLLGEDIASIFSMTDERLLSIKGITRQVVQGIREQAESYDKWLKFAENQSQLMEKCGGGIILLDDPLYPKYLKESTMCHPILYYKGNIAKFQHYTKSIAIVGSRNASLESLTTAEKTAKELGKNGWVIVSGMALGIDSAAHKGALEAKALTMAVVGCGADIVYPSKSGDLYNQIVDNGVIISEFPFGTKVDAVWLQKRNKTIVAAAHGTFVVQTADDGGAMNAVRGCKEQKKPIFTLTPREGDISFSGNAKVLGEYKGMAVMSEAAHLDIERLLS